MVAATERRRCEGCWRPLAALSDHMGLSCGFDGRWGESILSTLLRRHELGLENLAHPCDRPMRHAGDAERHLMAATHTPRALVSGGSRGDDRRHYAVEPVDLFDILFGGGALQILQGALGCSPKPWYAEVPAGRRNALPAPEPLNTLLTSWLGLSDR